MEGGSESRSNLNRPYNRQAAGSASRIAGIKELQIMQQNPLDAEIDDFAFDLYNSDDDDDQNQSF